MDHVVCVSVKIMKKPVFLEVEFLLDWGNSHGDERLHKKGEKAEIRDWIAKALVKRGIAKFIEREMIEKKEDKKV